MGCLAIVTEFMQRGDLGNVLSASLSAHLLGTFIQFSLEVIRDLWAKKITLTLLQKLKMGTSSIVPCHLHFGF